MNTAITFFEFKAPEMIEGQWKETVHSGMAEIVERGFQMQLGEFGYKLKVVSSAHYSPGTIVYAYPWSCGQRMAH